MTTQEARQRMCALVSIVGAERFDRELTHDCFCEGADGDVNDAIVEFIETVVRKELKSCTKTS
jgi:hypothetical protein